MGTMERLTYLLGICVAVVTWSVAQLNATVAADEVIAYGIQTKHISSKTTQIVFTIENMSHAQSPAALTIKMQEDPQGCISSYDYLPVDIALPVATITAIDGKRNGFEAFKIASFPPGGRLDLRAQFDSSCTVVPVVDLDPGSSAHPRLLKFGIETFILRRQFAIYAILLAVFAVVFAFTFIASYRLARRAPIATGDPK